MNGIQEEPRSENGGLREWVMVYGTLKSDGRLNGLLRDSGCEYVSTATLRGYSLVSVSGVFPAAMPDEHGTVEGEVWSIPVPVMRMLDEVENVPLMYDRIRLVAQNGIELWTYVWAGRLACEIGPERGSRWNNRTRMLEGTVVEAGRPQEGETPCDTDGETGEGWEG